MPFALDETFVRRAEEQLGATLPDSYRRRMMVGNGGEFNSCADDWTLYPIRDSSDKKRLARTCNDILAETASCAAWAGFPPQALAIAGNGDGDQLVFLRSGDAYGPAVYRWSHASGELARVADDFAALALAQVRP